MLNDKDYVPVISKIGRKRRRIYYHANECPVCHHRCGFEISGTYESDYPQLPKDDMTLSIIEPALRAIANKTGEFGSK